MADFISSVICSLRLIVINPEKIGSCYIIQEIEKQKPA
jgi:hypothetical protein